jgi:cobalamin synthase
MSLTIQYVSDHPNCINCNCQSNNGSKIISEKRIKVNDKYLAVSWLTNTPFKTLKINFQICFNNINRETTLISVVCTVILAIIFYINLFDQNNHLKIYYCLSSLYKKEGLLVDDGL